MVAVVSAFCLRFIASVGVSPSGKATVFGTVIRRFESCHPSHFLIYLNPIESIVIYRQSEK